MVFGLVGCNAAAGSGTETTVTTEAVTTEAPPAIKTIVADGATEYTIIRGEEATQSDIDQAIRLRQAIVEGTGVNIQLGTDWVKRGVEVPADGLEIVVGDTNRPQTVDARENQLRERDWGIFFSGSRVTITGGSDEATAEAVEYFIANCIDTESKKIELTENYSFINEYQYPIGSVKLDGVALSEYVIVTAAEPTRYEKYAALAFNDFLQAQAGYTLDIVDDTTAPADHEIIIGATSRAASKKYDGTKFGDMEYLLTAEGGSAVLRGEGYQIGGAVGALAALVRPAEKYGSTDAKLPTGGTVAKFTFADEATNAILLIGDGMGELQINLALSEGLDEFTPRFFPNQGYAKTYSASSSVTDSAASGTALSSGYKTINGYLGMNPKGETKMNIRELAASKGARTAVVTTDSLSGATPAAFTAHVKARDMSTEILAQQKEIDIQYLEGKMGDGLVDSSRAALRTIANGESDSFFIMIEEAYIDKHSHSNAGDDVVHTVKLLNEVATYLSQFAFIYPDTAIIVTADHECGGIKQKADGTFMFTSTSHTGVNVPVSAIGPGTVYFNDATVNNIEIAKFMGKIWGEDNFGG